MKIAVLAGNREQFENFMRQKDIGEPAEYVYADRMEKLICNRFDDYKTIGTFWDRKDANELYDEVKSRIK